MFSDGVVSFVGKRRYKLTGAPEANEKQGLMERVRRSGGMFATMTVWLALALFALAWTTETASAQGVVRDIEIEGNRRIETQTLPGIKEALLPATIRVLLQVDRIPSPGLL